MNKYDNICRIQKTHIKQKTKRKTHIEHTIFKCINHMSHEPMVNYLYPLMIYLKLFPSLLYLLFNSNI